MIKIKKDVLRFSFPAIAKDVERMVEDYTTRLLPTLLAEDRETVIEQFLDASHALCSSPEYQEKVQTTVTGLNAEDIEKLLRKHVKKQTVSYGYTQPGVVEIEFERTLRIPDDGKTYYLPPLTWAVPASARRGLFRTCAPGMEATRRRVDADVSSGSPVALLPGQLSVRHQDRSRENQRRQW
jgi:hypothetical protein